MNQEKKEYCKFLRAKNPYGFLEGGDQPWVLEVESNTVSWCIKSNCAIGPDSGPITPHQCIPGRSCYTPKDDAS